MVRYMRSRTHTVIRFTVGDTLQVPQVWERRLSRRVGGLMRKKIKSPCLGCGKEFMRYRGDLPYCEECLKPVKVYEPTPEQKKRMDQNMRKVNQALSKIF